jgi:hypothetical protein
MPGHEIGREYRPPISDEKYELVLTYTDQGEVVMTVMPRDSARRPVAKVYMSPVEVEDVGESFKRVATEANKEHEYSPKISDDKHKLFLNYRDTKKGYYRDAKKGHQVVMTVEHVEHKDSPTTYVPIANVYMSPDEAQVVGACFIRVASDERTGREQK